MKKSIYVLWNLLMFVSLQVLAKNNVIRILAIGNSFSEDAVEYNLHELFLSTGQQAIIANMYIGGCPLKLHWKNAQGNIADYRYRKINIDGVCHQTDNTTLKYALTNEKWDYVSLQQASGISGKYATYTPYMASLIQYVHAYAPTAKIIWHQTWAYAQNSDHGDFLKYRCSQKAMYDSIMSASTRVLKDYKIRIIVPSGTAIQNARTSFIGDNMNRDGYHLNLIYGRYTVACTWYETLSGKSVVGNRYAPKDLSVDIVKVAQEAAHAAVKSPFTITTLGNVPCTEVIYKDVSLSSYLRATDLCRRMTLIEKVRQLNQYTLGNNNNKNNIGKKIEEIPAEIGSLIYFGTDPTIRNTIQHKAMEHSRLGIPILFGYDVIHGFRTIFPIPLAQACSFNTLITQLACRVAAQETRMSGIDWTFSPMIDVAHDPRWGRVAEGYGEDPYMNGIFGAAAVRGYQGQNLNNIVSIAACLKHYVGYGASEAGHDYVYTEISRQSLWDTYLPPYCIALTAHPATVMSSFNNFSGIPVTGNQYLLTDVLKDKLHFQGFIISDWAAITQLQDQGMALGNKEAADIAINAGIDMDMMSHAYDKNLIALVKEGKVDSTRLNDAVIRVLKLKFDLGLFEHPYTPESTTSDRFLRTRSLELEENCAEESMVLLKNENNILPLIHIKKIAIVGPMIDARNEMLGCWDGHGQDSDVTSIREAMTIEFKDKKEMFFAKGCDFDGNDESNFKEAQRMASKADVVIVCLGERRGWSGENTSRANIELPNIQLNFLRAMKTVGKKIVLILSNGRPLQLNRMEPLADAILEMWQPGIAGGTPVARILSGKVNPSGKLAITFPLIAGQIPIYYNRRPSARPHQGFYQDVSSYPLYSFGDGQSYTHFVYSPISTDKQEFTRKDKITLSTIISNIGHYDGKETVLWYVSCPVSIPTRPIKELRFFEKKFIKAGQSEKYIFSINPMKDLAYPNASGNMVLAKGTYTIHAGNQSIELNIK